MSSDVRHLAWADDGGPLGSLPLSFSIPESARPCGREYLLLDRIGEGGMGEVWRARQVATGRDVAVKLLRHGASPARFEKEIAALARLDHPGIVRLYHAGQDGGRAFLVLELIAGESLAQELARGRLPPREAARAVREAAEALHAAHAIGLIHRDVKPSNLVRDAAGRIRVADFGLAKDLAAAEDLTLTGDRLGTPAYMAPEQIDPRLGSLGPATDVRGLGATLYHALTGRAPYEGGHPAEVLHQVARREPEWRLGWEDVHQDLRVICQRAMHRNPDRRYASASELADELGRFLQGEPVRTLPRPFVEGPAGGWRWVFGFVLLAGILGVLSTVVAPIAWRSRPSHRVESVDALLASWPTKVPVALHSLNLPNSPRGPRHVSFSDDGRYMAVSGGGGFVRVMALGSGKEVAGERLDHGAEIVTHAYRPENPALLTADRSGLWRLSRVDPVVRVVLEENAGSGVSRIAFSRDGTHLAVAGENGRIAAWDVGRKRHRRVFSGGHSGPVVALQFDARATRLMSASADGSIRVWSLKSDQPLLSWTESGPVLATCMAPDDSHLAFAFSLDGRRSQVRWHRLEDRTFVADAIVEGTVALLVYSPDGSRLAAGSMGGGTVVWAPAGRSLFALPEPAEVAHVEFSPDGLRLLIVDGSGKARIWDAHRGDPLTDAWGSAGGISHGAFAPDGIRLGSGDFDGGGTYWDASCPLPEGWDAQSLRSALLGTGTLYALRRAVWLDPQDHEALSRLADATALVQQGPESLREAAFLRELAAGRR